MRRPCPGCSTPTPIGMYACPACWKRLPAGYRRAVLLAYARRQKGYRGAVQLHEDAKTAADTWLKEHPVE